MPVATDEIKELIQSHLPEFLGYFDSEGIEVLLDEEKHDNAISWAFYPKSDKSERAKALKRTGFERNLLVLFVRWSHNNEPLEVWLDIHDLMGELSGNPKLTATIKAMFKETARQIGQEVAMHLNVPWQEEYLHVSFKH